MPQPRLSREIEGLSCTMACILVLNGPNLNLLGTREPEIYGTETLETINERLKDLATAAGHTFETLQSNAEHELIDAIQRARDDGVAYIIINPGALTHTSVALRDAFLGVEIPFIEVHLSNVHAREAFRRKSYLSDLASGVICGLGGFGYECAMKAALRTLNPNA